GLSAGIIPLAFFAAYWIKAFRGAFYLSRVGLQDASFQLPLMIYTFIIGLFGAGAFLFPWAMVTLCNAIPRPGGGIALGLRRRKASELSAARTRVGHGIPGYRPHVRSLRS